MHDTTVVDVTAHLTMCFTRLLFNFKNFAGSVALAEVCALLRLGELLLTYLILW